MKASQFEFRFRVAIITVLYFVGFFAPWARFGASANPNPVRMWSWLAIEAARTNLSSVGTAYFAVTTAAVALAILGALLRIWGTAYLGHFVMRNPDLQAGAVMAAGPYRHLRNPLYIGMLLTSFAIAILMPVTGALFFLIAMLVLTLRLIGAEEAFLATQLGETYTEYRRAVPSLLPTLRAKLPASAVKARWTQGTVAESFPLAVAGCFVVLAWSDDAELLTRCVLICFGVSLIVHAIIGYRSAKTV